MYLQYGTLQIYFAYIDFQVVGIHYSLLSLPLSLSLSFFVE